ncbi:MAG: cytochrome C oxidase subunit IV family protein [Saprospiraceae bacterium]|nr:cytochrome C oxidase subunit IV family protein [Saprospiraceae bacterium]
MGHLSYEEGKKVVFKGLIILGIVTLVEVFVALLGKGYIVDGFHLPVWLMYLAMIGMSLYKAYFIVYEFMHMRYEVPGLVKSVLLPTLLLIWMVIAFFVEGGTWRKWRAQANDRPIASFFSPVEKESTHGDGHHDAPEHKEHTGSAVTDSLVTTPIDTTGGTHIDETKEGKKH